MSRPLALAARPPRTPTRIRQLRRTARGGPWAKAGPWTRTQLAVFSGVAKSTLDRLETAEGCQDIPTLERVEVRTYRRIAGALGVPVKKLCPWLTEETTDG